MYQKLTELKGEPIVGRIYMVHCALQPRVDSYTSGKKVTTEWWELPTLGPEHDDKEIIGFPHKHYHYDFRFMTRPILEEVARGQVSFNNRMSDDDLIQSLLFIVQRTDHAENYNVTYGEKPIMCVRRAPIYPTRWPAGHDWGQTNNPIRFIKPLEDHYSEVKLACKKCPHRGLPLEGLPEDKDGNVVCPGHGLSWNTRTKQLNRRT